MIRTARRGDVGPIHNLVREAARNGRILKRSRRDIAERIGSFLVADAQGNVVGCCALDVYNKKIAEIRSMAVTPTFQKRGIAAALTRRCVAEAKKRRIYEVLVITDREHIFKRLGFQEQLHGQKALFMRPSPRHPFHP